jgi:nitrogen fixation protein
VTVPRGLGFWGDMVITLKDGSRLELRAVPQFRDLYDYINERISPQAQKASGALGK